MKTKYILPIVIFLQLGKTSHASDWTFTYNQQDNVIEADSFNAFGNICHQFVEEYTSEKLQLEEEFKNGGSAIVPNLTKREELKAQLEETEYLRELYFNSPSLLQYSAKQFIVEKFYASKEILNIELRKISPTWFNNTKHNHFFSFKFKPILPIIDHIQLEKRIISSKLERETDPIKEIGLKKRIRQYKELEDSYKLFTTSLPTWCYTQFELSSNASGLSFKSDNMVIENSIKEQKAVTLTFEDIKKLKNTLYDEYSKAAKELENPLSLEQLSLS